MTDGRTDGSGASAGGSGAPADGSRGPADGAFRLFPSGLDAGRRRVYRAVLVFFLAATAGLVWPVYASFGGIRPRVLGLPFSLFYVILWVVASFLVLLGVYLWEGGREDGSAGPDATLGDDAALPGDGAGSPPRAEG